MGPFRVYGGLSGVWGPLRCMGPFWDVEALNNNVFISDIPMPYMNAESKYCVHISLLLATCFDLCKAIIRK